MSDFISALPVEMRVNILSRCSAADLGRCAQVCHEWRNLVSAPVIRHPVAFKAYGVRDLGEGLAPLHPAGVHWQAVKNADGEIVEPLPYHFTENFDLKPGLFQNRPVLAGQMEGRPGIVVVDSETLEELAVLEDDRFSPRGWYKDAEGNDQLLIQTENSQPYSWNPETGEVTELPGIEDCAALNCPIMWQGVPSLLYLRHNDRERSYCVRPLQGGPSTRLESPSRSDFFFESPQRDLVLTHCNEGRYTHNISCWNAETGEQMRTIRLVAEIIDVTVVGKGEDARLVVLGRINTEGTDLYWVELPIYVFSLESGEMVQCLTDGMPRNGGFSVTSDGKTSYLHAFGGRYRRRVREEILHKCWQFEEGRARAIETGPLDHGAELMQLPDRRGRIGFEPFHGNHRFFFPTPEGLLPVDPVLRETEIEIAPESEPSESELSEAKSGTPMRSLLPLALLVAVCASGILCWGVVRPLRSAR